MNFQLIFTAQYDKRAACYLTRHPELEKQYLKTLQLLELNPHTPRCACIHSAAGCRPAFGLHQAAYRITIELLIKNNEITPINVEDYDECTSWRCET